MFQKARISDPTLELGGSSPINIPAAKDTLDIPLNTDLVYDLADMFLSLTYPDGAPAPETPWVSIASIAVNKLSVAIAANTTGQSRTVDMCLSHTDGGTVEKTDKGIYDSIEGDTLDSNIITIVQGN